MDLNENFQQVYYHTNKKVNIKFYMIITRTRHTGSYDVRNVESNERNLLINR